MRLHASCGSLVLPAGPEAVLLCGPPGSGKSDFLLRLIQRGFMLVADDQVLVEAGIASAPVALAGILEVRGLGLFRLPFAAAAPLKLVVHLGIARERLPEPAVDARFGLPAVIIDPQAASAPERVMLALDAAAGRVTQVAGAFAA